MAQGDVSNAKDDTRFYSQDAGDGLDVDLSHQALDLLAGAGTFYGPDGPRWDATELPWALDLVVQADDGTGGYLYSREAAGDGIRLSMAAGGVIEARVDGVVVATVEYPNAGAGPHDVVITWSMELYVFSTGAADAARSELRAYNRTAGGFVQSVATHALPADANADAIWGARTAGGADAFEGVSLEWRWSVGRFHPAAETREDFVEQTGEPTLVYAQRREAPVPSSASGIGAHDHFAGPAYQAVAAGLHQLDLRQAGAIVAELYRDGPTLSILASEVRRLADPDGDGFTFFGQYLVHRPLPRPTNRLAARVHIQTWREGGGEPLPLVVRCYSMARLPLGLAGNAGPLPAWTRFYREIEILAEHGSGTTGGAWYDFEALRIARDGTEDGTYLALAFAADPFYAEVQRWRVRAWTVEPAIVDTAGDLPLGGV